jgi:preprotein translocase subunit SecA
VHFEGNPNLHRTVQRVKALGKPVGVAINPATPATELEEILPEAFGAVKNVCRRLVGTEYEVRGHVTKWDMVPYDEQLIGGIVLHQGKITEMATGEAGVQVTRRSKRHGT